MDRLVPEPLVQDSRSLRCDEVTLSERKLGDTDLPQQTVTRTSLLMQVSAPVVVELGIDGQYQRRSFEPGEFCVIPAGERVVAVRWRGERQIVVAQLSDGLVRSVAESNDLQSFRLVSRLGIRDPRVSHLLLALREELLSTAPGEPAYVDMISRAIILRLLRNHGASASKRTHRGGLSRPVLNRVIEYIDSHLDEGLGLRNLATITGLSEDHFARAFRESTGVPPHRYLLQRRLAGARRLLETTDMPIVRIAQTLGFTDQSHLTNLFRREMGVTPGQVRASFGRNQEGRRNPAKYAGILQELEDN